MTTDYLRDRIISAGISLGLLTLVGTFARCEAPPKIKQTTVSGEVRSLSHGRVINAAQDSFGAVHNLYLHRK